MATGEKPYRVYRGGRTKGRVPLERPQTRRERDGRTPAPPRVRRPRRRWSWKRRIGVTLLLIVLLIVIWSIAGYLSFRGGVTKANDRLQKTSPGVERVLAPQDGAVLSNPTTILLLGRDFANTDQRVTLNHSDSIMVLRTDPSRHRLAYLSIPRDLRVAIPGYGEQKINTAMQIGGPALVVRTIEGLTGNALRINHVMIVDFANFKDLIDNVGGIDITVPAPILSNKFDCPYDAAGCARWKGWRFAKGRQHMDGRRALIYSRIRENQLDPRDTDISRGGRQQAVLRAALHKLLGFGTFVKLPFDGSSLLKPLTTDLSAWQFVQLGWVLKRAGESKALHCRLGGTSAGGDIIGSEDNRAVIAMVTGASAPQPPRPGEGLFAPGCVVGNQAFAP
ncbi:MAG TPA: LCP family protein [Gaiellaceae bacterium]|jgi:polyisoprenyl-teichoic acid--peptidoglycan teichoic acid transferase|nr:LCP family protein [Gaiellaceae bacterium]